MEAKKVVTFGEIRLRLSAPGFQRFVQAWSFDVVYGGGEANVAASLANYGVPVFYHTQVEVAKQIVGAGAGGGATWSSSPTGATGRGTSLPSSLTGWRRLIPGFVKAVVAPMPWTRIMPSGGVDATEESLRAWFRAGVVCAGIGSKLITKDLVAAGDGDGISKKVAQVLAWIQEARR